MYEIAIVILAICIPISFYCGIMLANNYRLEVSRSKIAPVKIKKRKVHIETNSDIEKWNIDNYNGPFSKQKDFNK